MRVNIDADGLLTSASIRIDEPTIGIDGDRAAAQARRLLIEAITRTYAALYPYQPRWEPKA